MAKKPSSATPATPTPTDQPEVPPPNTSAFTVLGWLLLVLSVVPLLMAAHGDGRTYLWSGFGMLLLGGVLLVAGHIKQNFE